MIDRTAISGKPPESAVVGQFNVGAKDRMQQERPEAEMVDAVHATEEYEDPADRLCLYWKFIYDP